MAKCLNKPHTADIEISNSCRNENISMSFTGNCQNDSAVNEQ